MRYTEIGGPAGLAITKLRGQVKSLEERVDDLDRQLNRAIKVLFVFVLSVAATTTLLCVLYVKGAL